MLTNITLSTKERYLLEDAKDHEEQCILKYQNYGRLAASTELKNVFHTIETAEKSHLDSINQLLNGTVPQMGGGQQSGQSQSSGGQQSGQSQSSGSQSGSVNTSGQNHLFQATDKDLCSDALSTEKYVSSVYDTAIFEFKNKEIRQVLNHIQKEEQEHGQQIFQYMNDNGLYQVQN